MLTTVVKNEGDKLHYMNTIDSVYNLLQRYMHGL